MHKFLVLLAGASMLAFAAPSVFDRYLASIREGGVEALPPAAAVVEVAAAGAPSAPRPAGAPAGRVVSIPAGPSGHFETTAMLNGRAVPVLVDTGATYVAVSETQARALGIRLGPGDFSHTARTANGESRVALARLDRVRIGTVEVRDVEAMVAKDGALSVTLLGMSFLSKLDRFEVDGQTMRLVE